MDWVKPHPEAFRAALAGVGVEDPARAVFVGDRLYDDVEGAQGVGMKAVWVRNAGTPAADVHPDATIDRLAQLADLIEHI
jgi:putative hydrolase of the HAD superfamily